MLRMAPFFSLQSQQFVLAIKVIFVALFIAGDSSLQRGMTKDFFSRTGIPTERKKI